MKKHILTFGTLLLLAAAGHVAFAQDDAVDPQVAAKLAARRAAEAAGTDAAAATPAQDAAAPGAAATAAEAGAPATASMADAGAATNATADDDDVRRKAAILAALKETEAANNLPGNLSALQIITHRNIFDPRRVAYRGDRAPVIELPPVHVETFTLRGTAHLFGKGWVAFFVGDGVPTYPDTRTIGDHVNDFKITDIEKNDVKLLDARSTNAAEIVIETDKGLTRNDGGPWKPTYFSPEYPASARSPRLADNAPPSIYQAGVMQTTITPPDSFSDSFGGQDDGTGINRTGRQRQRGQGGGGGQGGARQRGGGGGGFGGGAAGGGFGGNGGGGGFGGNAAFAPPQPAAPPGPADPIILQRLAQRRLQEQ